MISNRQEKDSKIKLTISQYTKVDPPFEGSANDYHAIIHLEGQKTAGIRFGYDPKAQIINIYGDGVLKIVPQASNHIQLSVNKTGAQ